MQVYYNATKNERCVISHRGTKGIEDWITDARFTNNLGYKQCNSTFKENSRFSRKDV